MCVNYYELLTLRASENVASTRGYESSNRSTIRSNHPFDAVATASAFLYDTILRRLSTFDRALAMKGLCFINNSKFSMLLLEPKNL